MLFELNGNSKEARCPNQKLPLPLKRQSDNFHIHTVHLDIMKVFYSPTEAQVNCLKNNFKVYIKIDIKTAPLYFSA
jgi:hypothetical protein